MKTLLHTVLLLVSIALFSQKGTVDNAINEGQIMADRGNGFYKNPIFPGNYGDPTLVRVKDDYYVAFSRTNGIVIWHSKDLVNWKPVVRHRLPEGYNTVWAIDLQYFDGKFHIYMPIKDFPNKKEEAFGNFVIIAKNPEGPWSDPINLEIEAPGSDYSGIDPGFIQTPKGEKYLYLNHGWVVSLNNEGTKAVSKPQKVYDGWNYPNDWVVECKCLESPKLFYKDGYYFMVSAQGGTNGPSTAHMSIVARAKHPLGPWENSPHNPLTHTFSQEEAFWHQGHGTVFEGADGSWWTIFHGRNNNFVEMGRPCLLMPIEWTNDGWPIQKIGVKSDDLIPKIKGENTGHGLALSDNFDTETLGMQWYYDNAKKENFISGNGKLIMKASGESFRSASEIYNFAPNDSYEIIVKIQSASKKTLAGLRMGYEGIVTDGETVSIAEGPDWRLRQSVYKLKNKKAVWLKIKNSRKDVSMFYSEDGANWTKFDCSVRSHESYKYSLFSYGTGEAVFETFKYKGL
ncbi:family 43 glycosylhydrolase [Flavobacterium nackdongense]|uniref:Beta-xylosidase n=1 Tax=Flavobacterium nackdongense TaxID=2547394 RepID=A0A4P6YHS4_9FLAO|nr:family 43 glycosylhydrolase [Flavobacterium nackdongense]QBN20504.1 hypothetical protein E1750_17485 [Flavobacterium nackdongense]